MYRTARLSMKRSRPELQRCLGATRFGQDRSPFYLDFNSMHPLEQPCIDADQTEIVGVSFSVTRWLIVIEAIVTMVPHKSFSLCAPQFEAHGDTATRLPRGYRVALYYGVYRTSPALSLPF